MNHESATIVQLAPGPNASNITFEQAFGEWSNARGKRQAKRTARQKARQEEKLERKTNRVQNRDAKKRVKSETRQLRKSDKRQNRQDLRIGRRAGRKEQRQDIRDDQQQRRQGRRDENKMRRVARKGFGQEEYEDPNLESNYQEDQGYDDQGYDDGGYDDQGYDDGGYQDAGYNDQGYDDSGYDDGGYDDGNYSEDGYNDDYGYEDEPDYETDYEEYYDYQPEWEGDFGNFDGEAQEGDIFMSETDENIIVPKNILETAVKIEWNKELIDQLQSKGRELKQSNTNDAEVKQALAERVARLKELCDAAGLYSSASGENAKIARKAKKIARSKRADVSPNYLKKTKSWSKIPMKTKVQSGMGAEIKPNRIEVPGKEVTSEFGGNIKNIDWKPIALGIGIGIGAIVILKVTKAIK